MSWYSWEGEDLVLRLRVQPKASRDAFISPFGDTEFKIAICAPPVDGKANAYLLQFLAKEFGVAKSQVTLVAGERSRSKIIRLKSPLKLPIAMVR